MGKYGKLKGLCRGLIGKDHPDLDSFNEKMVLQKGVYLAKQLGAECFQEYTFGWHVRGTYSPGLTVDIYQLPKEKEPAELNPAEESTLAKLKALSKGATRDLPGMLEVTSAVVYAFKEKHMNVSEVKEFTRRTKPWFSETEIGHALKWAQEQGLASG